MREARPNARLAEVMQAAGLSNKALARGVREASGGRVNCDHTAVSRWLAGMKPRGDTPRLIAQVLTARAGRTVTLAEIGLSIAEEVNPGIGTEYGPEVESATAALATLWRADLDDVQAITAAPPDFGAWSHASLSWLVRPDRGRVAESPSGRRVGESDVDAVRATVAAFAGLDNRFGGGHARRALVQYLHSDLAGLLAGRYNEATGRALYAAAAEATLLAAWTSYDAGTHGLAQRYFIQALRLAHAADDVLLAASILDAMSHQATFLGRVREAANLARAARSGTQGSATPTLTAHFHAMEARALAAGGDASGAQRALNEAVRVFERRQPGGDPEWISYFDDAELSAEFAHCFRDMGRAGDAVTYAERAIAGSSVRSDFFVSMVLATGQLRLGEVDQACATAAEALEAGRQVKSARCREYVTQFRCLLSPFSSSSPVQELAERMREHPYWITKGPVA